MTAARVQCYDPTNTTYRGLLPTRGLNVSHEVGSAGSLTFDALSSHLDAVSGWDSVLRLQLWDGTSWVTGPAYTLRPPFTRAGVTPAEVDSVWQCQATGLLETWASETLILPEYTLDTMPHGAGTDRILGWPSSAYDPASDPNEAWDGCYETSRTTMPADWPTGSGATWISITGASDTSERKLFRATLTVTATSMVKIWFHSDEDATLSVAGEPVLPWSASESQGKDPAGTALMVLQPGTYAVAVDTRSVWNTGGTGDGQDPILVAAALIEDGDPVAWLLVSDDTWFGCRRDDEPPGNEPPGPTPGALIRYLVEEAQERGTSGWAGVTCDFTDTHDSYDQPWSTVVIERVTRYGSDTLWSVFNSLSEAGEADVWLDAANTLHAAPRQGAALSIALDGTTVRSSSDTKGSDAGTWCAALAHDGWTAGWVDGAPRREFAMELGTALSRATADRVVGQALAENGRRDFRAKLLPVVGKVPLVDYQPGDRMPFTFGDVGTDITVLSLSASAGDGGLLWEGELAEVPS